MQIIGYTDNMDLRTVISRSAYLRRIADRFSLKTNQAVCFTNKALTRFRLILKINNVVFLCIPEIDEKSKISVFLRISEELSALAGIDQRQELKLVSKLTQERIDRRKRVSSAIKSKQQEIRTLVRRVSKQPSGNKQREIRALVRQYNKPGVPHRLAAVSH